MEALTNVIYQITSRDETYVECISPRCSICVCVCVCVNVVRACVVCVWCVCVWSCVGVCEQVCLSAERLLIH